MQNYGLEFIAILDGQISARTVDSPAWIAMEIIEDILESDENPRAFAHIEAAAQVEKRVGRQAREKRNGGVVIDDRYAVYRRADGQYAVLDLRECLARCNQNSARRAAAGCAGRRQAIDARAATEEVLDLSARARRARATVGQIKTRKSVLFVGERRIAFNPETSSGGRVFQT